MQFTTCITYSQYVQYATYNHGLYRYKRLFNWYFLLLLLLLLLLSLTLEKLDGNPANEPTSEKRRELVLLHVGKHGHLVAATASSSATYAAKHVMFTSPLALTVKINYR